MLLGSYVLFQWNNNGRFKKRPFRVLAVGAEGQFQVVSSPLVSAFIDMLANTDF